MANKNSQYINSANVNISEMARITFQEQINNEIVPVIIVSMHIEFMKELYRVIGASLENYMDKVSKINQDRDVN